MLIFIDIPHHITYIVYTRIPVAKTHCKWRPELRYFDMQKQGTAVWGHDSAARYKANVVNIEM